MANVRGPRLSVRAPYRTAEGDGAWQGVLRRWKVTERELEVAPTYTVKAPGAAAPRAAEPHRWELGPEARRDKLAAIREAIDRLDGAIERALGEVPQADRLLGELELVRSEVAWREELLSSEPGTRRGRPRGTIKYEHVHLLDYVERVRPRAGSDVPVIAAAMRKAKGDRASWAALVKVMREARARRTKKRLAP